MKEFWTAIASLMGVVAFCQTLITALFPPSLRYTLFNLFSRIATHFSTHCYFDITEIDGVNTNELYTAVQLYLSSTPASTSATRLSLTRSVNSSAVIFGLSHNDTLHDTFNGVPVQWDHIVTQRPSQAFSWRPMPDEKRGFALRVSKAHKPIVVPAYLDHIMRSAVELRRMVQDRYLYTNTRGGSMDSTRPGHPWEAVPFKHPSTFDTLAMDPDRKAQIVDDLQEFASGEAFYRATGRAWKRGYLLYGPPGTGKSSMIAAMANLLGYDIYDLEITEVASNSELRKLLMKTTSKSIIVIEDIDCSVDLSDRKSKKRGSPTRYEMGPPGQEDGSGSGSAVTLSGLLNFTDGLWSCCGSERIFVFTTNHVERLDPALLRCGRMDMHVHMSYCTLQALLILVRNYVGLGEEDLGDYLVAELGDVVDQARITPADVSEVLIRHRRDGVKAVAAVLDELRRRVIGNKPSFAVVSEEEEEEEEKRELLEVLHNQAAGEEVNHDEDKLKGGDNNDVVVQVCSKGSHVDDNNK